MLKSTVSDCNGNKYETITECNFGAILTTATLPELRTIDCMCIAPDGYVSGKLRDNDFRGQKEIDNNNILVTDELLKRGLFLPAVKSFYGFIHPDNIRSLKMFQSRGTVIEGEVMISGIKYFKVVTPFEVMNKMAERIRNNV
jgi:hypothetical protein